MLLLFPARGMVAQLSAATVSPFPAGAGQGEGGGA
jgi:hypothetical protein